jgi:hypothetical protein
MAARWVWEQMEEELRRVAAMAAMKEEEEKEEVRRRRTEAVKMGYGGSRTKRFLGKFIDFILVFYPHNLIAPKMMDLRLPPAPCCSRILSCPSSVAPTCFWLVVVYIRCRLRPRCIFILDFSIAQFNGPNDGITPHPTLID